VAKGNGNPHPGDGYTLIANETLDVLATIGFPPSDRCILDFIFRWTYGWFQRKQSPLKPSMIALGTGIPRPHVSRSLARLEQKKVIFRKDGNIGFNKYYQEWEVEDIRRPVTNFGNFCPFSNGGITNNGNNQEIITDNGNSEEQEKVTNFGNSEDDSNGRITDNGNSETELPPEVTTVTDNGNSELPPEVIPSNTKHSRLKKEKENYKEKETASPPVSFQDWLDLLNSPETTNKVGLLVEAFKAWHPKAPPSDFENLGGRIAGFQRITKDLPVILKAIWDTATMNPVGSHLNYIQKKLQYKPKDTPDKPTSTSKERKW